MPGFCWAACVKVGDIGDVHQIITLAEKGKRKGQCGLGGRLD